jgi:hypothetical protein
MWGSMNHQRLVRRTFLTIFIALSVAPRTTAAQVAVDSAMRLNRAGLWTSAAEVARQALDSSPSNATGRCSLRVSLVYAEVRLGRSSAARSHIDLARSECRDSRDVESEQELSRLIRELDAPQGVVPTEVEVSTGKRPDDAFWRMTSPSAVGLSATAVTLHRGLCERTGADACLVISHNQIVDEWYSARYSFPMYAMSSTKSVTALLTIMLVADGRIGSLDDPVCRYVTDWCGGRRGRVTIRHLLSMTSGLPRLPADSSVGYVEDKNTYVIGLAPVHPPGTVWAYSNEGAQLMSAVLDAAAGEPIQAYAARRLFAPLGMRNSSLHLDVVGHAWTYADMLTTARDFARIGILVLSHGRWEGRQIVPTAMLDSLFVPQALNPHYGMLWWLDPEVGSVATHGHLDTDIHVLPGSDLVIVRMQSKPFRGVAEGTYERELLTLLKATDNLARN